MGVVLAVNGEAVDSRNTSNDCGLNRFQKRCFILGFFFCFFFFYLILSWTSSDAKGKILFDAFTMNNKVLLYL